VALTATDRGQGWLELDMNPTKTVVVVHAHPDDEAIFTGVTIRRAVDRGARVVLVSATGGEAGDCRIDLAVGETLHRRRLAELERACELLGVSRLVTLGYQDSGAHRGPYRPGTLGAAPVAEVARRVEQVVREEDADALVYYDHRGITGHVDHLQVHRAGRQVVARLGIAGYEATLDRAAVRRGSYQLAQSAAGGARRIGVPSRSLSLTVSATVPELLAKMAAMAAHGSQIAAEWLDASAFGHGYGCEWFVRRGAPGILENVTAAAAVEGTSMFAADIKVPSYAPAEGS
jgi:LmbE family N-acetylglucosaminyl deacetylase